MAQSIHLALSRHCSSPLTYHTPRTALWGTDQEQHGRLWLISPPPPLTTTTRLVSDFWPGVVSATLWLSPLVPHLQPRSPPTTCPASSLDARLQVFGETDPKSPGLPVKLSSAAVAGFTAAAFSLPFDMLKSRLQASYSLDAMISLPSVRRRRLLAVVGCSLLRLVSPRRPSLSQ